MKLQIETLESRRALAAYTLELLDPGDLITPEVENQMLSNLDYAVRNISNFVSWKGTLDVRLQINPTHSGYRSGIATAITSNMPDGRNAAIYEMTTGIDPYPNSPDCGAVVWLASDGTAKVYGKDLYYDPSPAPYVPASVPSGRIDFVGVMTHEIFHGIGIRNTVEFDRHLTRVGGNTYFVGPNTVAALGGRRLPYVGGGHYGNTSLPDNPIQSGLMFQWANNEGNRLDIGRLDLAILKDLGLSTKNEQGLPLVDRMDSQIPRNTLSNNAVNENVPLGTTVGVVSTTAGPSFRFSLPSSPDNRFFRIVGNTLVTNAPLDFETRSGYRLVVRSTDAGGLWSDAVVNVFVRDVRENPKIVAPSRVNMINGTVSLGSLGLTGDSSTVVSMVIFSRRGVITSRITDPAVKAYVVRNTSGGTTALLVGSIQAINRNTRNLSYAGDDSKLVVDIAACIGGVCRNYGRHELELVTGIRVGPVVGINPILKIRT